MSFYGTRNAKSRAQRPIDDPANVRALAEEVLACARKSPATLSEIITEVCLKSWQPQVARHLREMDYDLAGTQA